MASHGGMIGLTFYTLWYARRHHVSWRNLGDNLVVVTPLGLFFGRIANFINGELYGRVASTPWAIQFPKELYEAPLSEQNAALRAAEQIDSNLTTIQQIDEASRTSPQLREALSQILLPRHPSQIYEAILEGAFLFAMLWLLRTKVRLPTACLPACSSLPTQDCAFWRSASASQMRRLQVRSHAASSFRYSS